MVLCIVSKVRTRDKSGYSLRGGSSKRRPVRSTNQSVDIRSTQVLALTLIFNNVALFETRSQLDLARLDHTLQLSSGPRLDPGLPATFLPPMARLAPLARMIPSVDF